MKALAWLNLTKSQEAGEVVRSGDIRKHLEDVINLSSLLNPQMRVNVVPKISNDLQEFITRIDVQKYPEFVLVKERLI